MLAETVLQVTLALFFRFHLLSPLRQCLLCFLAFDLERRDAGHQCVESILDRVDPKIICLNLEKRGNFGIHVGSSKIISGYVQTTAIGVLQAR
jgi:hypothetical protein